eukprot:TRINITY_DN865_c0_g1_i1.p1 TRINITY_DN865_c0_g1~~TRINITY_DN865_c0_g1_i1.p1  ORF type:complete len:546 (+),score=73.51 TRINITY_DN865_c0_g1_i1:426-2063(+)
MDQRSGFCTTNGIYYSKEEPVELPPASVKLDIVSYVFSHLQNLSGKAYIDASSGLSLDYLSLVRNAKAVAAGLSGLGVRKGDVVLVLSANSVILPCIYLGILSLGAVLTAANPLNSEREILNQIADSKAKFAFTLSSVAYKIAAAKIPLILIDDLVGSAQVRTKGDSEVYISTLAELLLSENKGFTSVEIDQEDTATLLYSSGTTGKSKGVVSTHRNLISAVAAMRKKDRNRNICLFTVPIFHMYGFAFLLRTIAEEGTAVMLRKFDLAAMLSAIERYRVQAVPASPPVLVALIKSPIVNRYNLSSLEFVGSGGSNLGKELVDSFSAKFPDIKIGQGYGLTETSGLVAGWKDLEEHRHRNQGVGFLLRNMEAKLVDIGTGKALPPNQKGELWVRGPSIMKGYLGNKEATEAVIDKEGWLKTGDLCYFDDDGFLFVVDRIKELIKYKAFQVPPAELEELLLSHPEIVDAAVIPYPDEEAGQIPMAFVVRKPGSRLSEEDVMSYIAKQVSPYKKIRKVAFVDAIPKTPTGKLLKKDLIPKAHLTSKL